MYLVQIEANFESWRYKARQLLAESISPDHVVWSCNSQGFHLDEPWTDREVSKALNLPREFIDKAMVVSCFRDESTWDLLYRIAFRILYEEKNLLQLAFDPSVKELESRYRLVIRDAHKMKAFVRFKEIQDQGKVLYVAWHRPDHRICRLVAPFFRDRFNGMNWIIMTEDESIHWDQENLSFSPGVPEQEAPKFDATEDLWKVYYSSIFNPARIKISAMKKEMPVRHWKTLPESQLITSLIDEAPERLQQFYESQKQNSKSLETCRACGICEKSQGPVKGEGPLNAQLVLVGEQPGNEEDLQKRPFVGPSGELLNQMLKRHSFKREEIYVTNAVKGFKHILQGTQRWHRSANGAEISACRPWLKQELETVKPKVLVCLGRTAAQSIIGKAIRLEDYRGKIFKTQFCDQTIVLPHPASLLRMSDPAEQAQALEHYSQEFQQLSRLLINHG